jgi:arsenate reductase-like glutaredoxin family protein
MTCQRTQGFLAKTGITPRVVTDAKRTTQTERDALALAGDADEIWAAKGKKVVHLDLRHAKPAKAELRAVLLGPTGNLRAPTLRVGRTLIVGFDEATYQRHFG